MCQNCDSLRQDRKYLLIWSGFLVLFLVLFIVILSHDASTIRRLNIELENKTQQNYSWENGFKDLNHRLTLKENELADCIDENAR
jgi:hypothetical protein